MYCIILVGVGVFVCGVFCVVGFWGFCEHFPYVGVYVFCYVLGGVFMSLCEGFDF
jgi:hypothetical protein